MKFQVDRKTFIMYVHTCHGIFVEARGTLKKFSPSHHVGFGDGTQVTWQ